MTLNNTNNNKIIIIIIVIIIIIIITINNKIPKMGFTLLVLLFRQLKQFCPVCYMNFSVCLLMGLTLQRYSSVLIGFIVKTVYLLRSFLLVCYLAAKETLFLLLSVVMVPPSRPLMRDLVHFFCSDIRTK